MNTDIVFSFAGFAIAGLIAAGVHKATTREHERRITSLEEIQGKLFDRINSMGEIYVSYRHFNEVMVTVKEAQQELKADVKRVLDILSQQNHNHP